MRRTRSPHGDVAHVTPAAVSAIDGTDGPRWEQGGAVGDVLPERLVHALREKEAAEEALRDLQARIDNAQQLAHMGDYDWEIASDINTWSDQLFKIYGHEPGAFNPSYEMFISFIHPEDRERIQAIHQQAYATGEPYEMIERIVRPDGEVRYLSSNGQVVTDEHGNPVRMRGTCIDITERVHAEEEREAHAARVHEEQTRRQAALEINDSVVQGLTAALYALELDDTDAVRDYVRRTLDSARAIITDLVGPVEGKVAPGDLVRTSPSTLPD
jgi:PAS domain S-box-containing protein